MSKFVSFVLVVLMIAVRTAASSKIYPYVGSEWLHRMKRDIPKMEQPISDIDLSYSWPTYTYPAAPIISGINSKTPAMAANIVCNQRANWPNTKEKSVNAADGGVGKTIYQMAYQSQPQFYSLPVSTDYKQPYPVQFAPAVQPVAYPSQKYYYDLSLRSQNGNGNQIQQNTDAELNRSRGKNVEYVALPYDAKLESIRRQDVTIDDKYNMEIRPSYLMDRIHAAAQEMAMPYGRTADETFLNSYQRWNGPTNGQLSPSPLNNDYIIMNQFDVGQDMATVVNQPKQMVPARSSNNWNGVSVQKTHSDDLQTEKLVSQLYAMLLETQKTGQTPQLATIGNGKSKDAEEQQTKSSSIKETKQQNSAVKPEEKVEKQN